MHALYAYFVVWYWSNYNYLITSTETTFQQTLFIRYESYHNHNQTQLDKLVNEWDIVAMDRSANLNMAGYIDFDRISMWRM